MTHLSLPRLLLRSLLHRRARGLSALIALSVSAAVATALLTLYADLDRKMHQEFRSFGANLTITAPTPGQPLPPDTLARARAALPANIPISPIAYAVATTAAAPPIVVAGVDFPTLRPSTPGGKSAPGPQLLKEPSSAPAPPMSSRAKTPPSATTTRPSPSTPLASCTPAPTKIAASTSRSPPSPPGPASLPASSSSRSPVAPLPSTPPSLASTPPSPPSASRPSASSSPAKPASSTRPTPS